MPVSFRTGWVRQQPDHRDYRYHVSPLVLRALPERVDLVDPEPGSPFSPAWDQQDIGSCGPHSSCADIVFDLVKNRGLRTMPSRLFVYWCTRYLMGTIDQDSGVDNRSMLKSLNRFGWCDEELWPYVPARFMQRPPQACFDQAAARRITAYFAVPQTLDQMKGCLASGDPFIFGFTVFRSTLSDQTARTGDVPMPGMFERPEGGHDVLMVGYDDRTRRFKFRNSWGSSWGRNGYGTIPYEYAVNPNLAGDFWTVQKAAFPAPVPDPTPTPAPQPIPSPVPGGTMAPYPTQLTDELNVLLFDPDMRRKVHAAWSAGGFALGKLFSDEARLQRLQLAAAQAGISWEMLVPLVIQLLKELLNDC